MSNVLELYPGMFRADTCNVRPTGVFAKGDWVLEGAGVPNSLAALFGGNVEYIRLKLMATMFTDEKLWLSAEPFLLSVGVIVDHDRKAQAGRVLSPGHIWGIGQRKIGVVFHPRVDVAMTYPVFCAELFAKALADMIGHAKATIRWDEKGLVVAVNAGATYLSTREHSVDANDPLMRDIEEE